MGKKVVDENNMIIKPIIFGRSKNKYNMGDVGRFNSNGWLVSGYIFSVRYWEDERFISSDGYFVYEISNCKKIKWIGIEMTEQEIIDHKKEEEKKKQLKFKL